MSLGLYAVNLGLCYGLAIEATLEVVDRDGLCCCDAVVDSGFLHNLVDGLDLVSELGDDVLLFDDGLDGLVQVVVDRSSRCGLVGGLGLVGLGVVSVLELCLFGSDLGLDLLTLLVLVDLALLCCFDLGILLDCVDLTVLERLNGGVVVILVDFAVDDLLLPGLVLDASMLMFDSRGNGLLDGCILFPCSSSVNDWSYLLGLGSHLDLRGLDLLSRDLFGLDFIRLGLLSLGGVEVLTCTGAEVLLV